jgi:hypothetical protein
MATPSPISAIRNSTIWLTPVISVSPLTTRKVASTETPPMSRGRKARKLPNTTARMSRAPRPPIIDSASTPVPLLLLAGLPACSSCMPVSPACQPRGAAWVRARWMAGAAPGPPNPVCGAVNTSANVDRPSRVRNARSCVVA